MCRQRHLEMKQGARECTVFSQQIQGSNARDLDRLEGGILLKELEEEDNAIVFDHNVTSFTYTAS